MFRIVGWVACVCAAVFLFCDTARADDHCKGWDHKSTRKAICIRFPEGDPTAKRLPLVVFVPGCEGFDGEGYLGQFALDKRRVPDVQKGFRDYYEQKSELLLQSGFAVAKIDYTRKTFERGFAQGGFNCNDTPSSKVIMDVAQVVGQGIGWLKNTYRTRIDTTDIRLISSSLGGEGTLMMLKLWPTLAWQDKPKRIVTLYPLCATEVIGWLPQTRHLFIYGDRDEVPTASPPTQVISLAIMCKRQAQNSATMEVNLIQNAGHAFDVPIQGEPVRARRGNYSYIEYVHNAPAEQDAWRKIMEFIK